MNTDLLSRSPGFPSAVHTAPPDISIYDAARLMSWRKVGVVVVVRDHYVLGILTDRDLTTRALAEGLEPRSTRIRRVMTSPVVSVEREASDDHILQQMLKHRVRQVPLVDAAGRLVGLAALDPPAGGQSVPSILRSTVLVPMVKRRRWRRLVYRLTQAMTKNLRWIGATLALAALGGLVSLVVVGQWNPWTPTKPVAVLHPGPPREQPRQSFEPKAADPDSPRASIEK